MALKIKEGVWNYKKLLVLEYDDITALYKSDHITLVAWRFTTYWKMYADAFDPPPAAVMVMASELWELIDRPILQINH